MESPSILSSSRPVRRHVRFVLKRNFVLASSGFWSCLYLKTFFILQLIFSVFLSLFQVNGCDTDLPNKAYHQRYRICQNHAAMPQMVLDGRNVRFCQHCGRFQTLQEFDGAFKSCRKSLQRHRNSQSRRIRTKSSTKASSGSDEFSGGGSKNRRTSKRSPATGGPNSSINDTVAAELKEKGNSNVEVVTVMEMD